MRIRSSFFLPILLVATMPPLRAGVDRWLVGDPGDALVDAGSGLLLAGGGRDVDAAMAWFLGKAEGGDVVVLRASGEDGYNDYLFGHLGVVVDSVETLRFNTREDGFDPEAVATIERAEAVFLAGGDQSRYLDFWEGSPVVDALNRHLAAGGTMGGTSAGLAVLGEFAYGARHRGDLTSEVALGRPLDDRITMESGFLRSPLLRGVLTDSHFSERSRLGRLIVMLNRVGAAGRRADLLGLGVDEHTALCVEADGSSRVLTDDGGTVTLVTVPAGGWWDVRPGPFGPAVADIVVLGPGSRLDLKKRMVDEPVAASRIRAEHGRLGATEPES